MTAAYYKDLEQEAAIRVQVAKEEVLLRLPEEDHKTVRRWGQGNSTNFEDHAICRLQAGADDQLKRALTTLQTAVNDMWVLVIESGLPRQLARDWWHKAKDRSYLTLDDVETEVVFLLRNSILTYKPGPRSFKNFVYKIVFAALTDWAQQQQAPLSVPRQVARSASVHRAPTEEEDSGS